MNKNIFFSIYYYIYDISSLLMNDYWGLYTHQSMFENVKSSSSKINVN